MDDIFKKPLLPSQKRKLEPIQDPNQAYKVPKLNGNDTARSWQATVQDEEVRDGQDDQDDDMEAGPELPPDFDEEDLGGDEEGRFFGGGVSESTVDAINYLDATDGDAVAGDEKLDIQWLRRTAVAFEKKINKNAELRAKFDGQPDKFMASEADLDAEIKALSLLSEHPELYSEFAVLGCTASLVGLLAHENTDIAIDAVEIIGELIDDDVQANEAQWNSMVDGMIEADLLSLLHANLGRLDEAQEEDRTGVYNILGVMESLASRTALANKIGESEDFMPWILNRAKRKEQVTSQNKQYAAEICAILLQSSSSSRSRVISLDGIDTFLQLLSAYRKRDPEKGSDEEEFVENLFDGLACLLDDASGKAKFLEAEGIELCLIMLREGKMSKPRALRLLDHALGGKEGATSCESFVEAAGLGPLFTAFMKKQDLQSTEHILSILSSMLRYLPADSAPRIRLLAKFMEKDYQKISRLTVLQTEYLARVQRVDKEIERERKDLDAEEQEALEDEWLSRRLDAGLFTLRTIQTILAWIAAEDEGAHSKVASLCNIEDIRTALKEEEAGAEEEAKEMFVALARAI